MMRRIQFYLLVTLTIIFTSCEKDRATEDIEIKTDTSTEVSIAGNFYSMIYQISRDEAEAAEKAAELSPDQTSEFSSIDPCALISYYVDPNQGYISQLTITYSDIECNSWGRNKYGKIKVYLTGKVNEVGTIMTIIPEGFFINNKKVEGTLKISNIGFNTDYMYLVNRVIIDGKIGLDNDAFFTWNSNEELEIDFFNDETFYKITANAVNEDGLGYNVSTISPLKSKLDCEFFQSGELQINTSWGVVQSINYGDGSCDNQAEIWQEGNMIMFEMK